jgi:hypothetical protein
MGIRKEIRPLLELVGALTITPILVVTGIVYNIIKPFVEAKNKPFLFVVKTFFLYWLNLLVQVWRSLQYWMHHTAIYLDYIWNVIAGEMLEDIFTHKENTWFGHGKTTVSASIGQLESKGLLNKKGRFFSRFLDKVFREKNHSLNAYNTELQNRRK